MGSIQGSFSQTLNSVIWNVWKNPVKIKLPPNKFLSQYEKSVKCRQKLAKLLVGTFGVLPLSHPKHSKLFFDSLENSSRQESLFFQFS